MGVVTVSSSATQTPLGLGARFSSSNKTPLKRPLILAFKSDNKNNKSTALVTTSPERIPLSAETPKPHTRRKRASSSRKRVKFVVSTDEALACDVDLDYSEAATKLENLYKLSPPSDVEDSTDQRLVKRRGRRTKKKDEKVEEVKKEMEDNVTKIQKKKMKRLNLDKRIAIRRKEVTSSNKAEDRDADRLVREYSVATTDLVSLDWKKMKIPPVLPSSEHTWLFKLMQPMKALLKVKESLHKDFGREPTDGELAAVTSMDIPKVRKQIEVGLAARNKLIKHNLRLVLFVINKYFQEFANGSRFQDLCQAGVKGLITAIDRFEPKRRFRLSTYGLFWIRHAIMRSMTLSSFTRVSFGLESVRIEIQRTKLELTFELGREPTEQEILEKVGISPERYREVMRASKPVYSLNARHPVTQEEFIDALTDVDGVGGDKRRQPALLRLALDDVLDSLKPKESLVIRQRYGLDGKGDRTLGEIAGNLNISREMVRKHEVKALMKLKHPARVDYLRRYIF